MALLVYLCAGLVPILLLFTGMRRRLRYPPGPKGVPIFGNIFDVPMKYAWLEYVKYGRRYESDIIHFQVLGQHIVVLNSLQAVGDLLDKQSSIYSDRVPSVMLNELTGWSRSWVQMEYGDRWRMHRRLMQQHFRSTAIPQYHSKQTKAVCRLVQSLLEQPEHFMEHIHFLSGSLILDVVFSFDVRPGDAILALAERAVDTTKAIIAAGVWLVDVVPILKYVPAWFPGAGFKRTADKWKTDVNKMFDVPYAKFKASMLEGNVTPCFASALLSEAEDHHGTMENLDEVFISLTGTAYAAGSDTMVDALSTFILAMIVFPEKQRTAHDALDRVLDRKRLPDIADQGGLPHITALLYEVLRWHPIVPLSIPHRTSSDSYYKGYLIPAGSTIFPNTWAILHDEALYPEPHLFKPERFLEDDGSLHRHARPPTEAFGYGRRICPGRHFAHDALWLAIAHILGVFKIERALDESGNEIEPQLDFTPHFLSMPKPFKCRFTPRFPDAANLLLSTSTDY